MAAYIGSMGCTVRLGNSPYCSIESSIGSAGSAAAARLAEVDQELKAYAKEREHFAFAPQRLVGHSQRTHTSRTAKCVSAHVLRRRGGLLTL